jgi:hypothetical protein
LFELLQLKHLQRCFALLRANINAAFAHALLLETLLALLRITSRARAGLRFDLEMLLLLIAAATCCLVVHLRQLKRERLQLCSCEHARAYCFVLHLLDLTS